MSLRKVILYSVTIFTALVSIYLSDQNSQILLVDEFELEHEIITECLKNNAVDDLEIDFISPDNVEYDFSALHENMNCIKNPNYKFFVFVQIYVLGVIGVIAFG